MTIALSVYDVFSYTVPGVLYLYIVYEMLKSFGWGNFDIPEFIEIGLVETLFVIGFAFVAGHLAENISYKFWFRFVRKVYNKDEVWEEILENFKNTYPDLEIKFKDNEPSLLYNAIKKRNFNVSQSIDKNGADFTMLHNLAFALLLFALLQINIMIFDQLSAINIALATTALILSVIAYFRSIKFREMYYASIYEVAIN